MYHIRALTASGTSSVALADRVRGNLGSGCLQADVAKHAGLPDNQQQLNRSRQYSFSYNSRIKCFRTHVDMDICLVLVRGTRA
jgi:hypothetical protein